MKTFTLIERQALARMMIRLFAAWGVSDQDGAILLAVDEATYQTFRQNGAVPDNALVLERAGCLQAILLSLYRGNIDKNDSPYRWVKISNTYFSGKTPLEAMKEGGLPSIIEVRNYLYHTANGGGS